MSQRFRPHAAHVLRLAALLLTTLCVARTVSAQALPTASRRADLQVGADFSFASPDYTEDEFHGYGFYASLDLRRHIGLEFTFHQLTGPQPVVFERTYNFGPRFPFPLGRAQRIVPYVKAMVGRGDFNFPGVDSSGHAVELANLAYNIYSFGAGVDFHLTPGINIRVVDFEYQKWPNFPPSGLNPTILSFGVAYHFHSALGHR